jgi:uncharacterized protein YecE (DUF72 family)
VYSKPKGINYLAEYALKYNSVEIDQWFYRLPEPVTVNEYVQSTPENFTFAIKAPNQITLTHFRNRTVGAPLKKNPDFLSIQVFNDFLTRLEPMRGRIETIIFEFEYLNKQKMGGPEDFLGHLESFIKQLPSAIPFSFEPRNPQYLTREYFELLQNSGTYHVFSEKIYMPPITEIYQRAGTLIRDKCVIRLLGGDRKKIEATTKGEWNRLVEPKDAQLEGINGMAADLMNRRIKVALYVNNHFEGSAPLTIDKITDRLAG